VKKLQNCEHDYDHETASQGKNGASSLVIGHSSLRIFVKIFYNA
jgi:hypothetical protein